MTASTVTTAPMSASTAREDLGLEIDLRLDAGFAHAVDFGLPGVEPLIVDEPPPLGEGRGPNPSRLLASAVASCLASSLLFCLRKSRIDVTALDTHVTGRLERNDRGRLRVAEIHVVLSPLMSEDDRARIGRCVEVFEDYCLVTQSVRDGIRVSVDIHPQNTGAADETQRR